MRTRNAHLWLPGVLRHQLRARPEPTASPRRSTTAMPASAMAGVRPNNATDIQNHTEYQTAAIARPIHDVTPTAMSLSTNVRSTRLIT